MKKTFLALCVVTVSLFGCETTYLKDSLNVSNEKKSYDKILVVSRSPSRLNRISFENKVVENLAAQNVSAESSIDLIDMDVLSKELSGDEIQELKQKLLQEGYDGVIVTNLIDARQYTDVIPGTYRSAGAYPSHYRTFGGYYGYYPLGYWEPDRLIAGVEYTLESCLYDLRTDSNTNLEWVGRFLVQDPTNLTKTIDKYAGNLTDALLEQSIAQ